MVCSVWQHFEFVRKRAAPTIFALLRLSRDHSIGRCLCRTAQLIHIYSGTGVLCFALCSGSGDVYLCLCCVWLYATVWLWLCFSHCSWEITKTATVSQVCGTRQLIRLSKNTNFQLIFQSRTVHTILNNCPQYFSFWKKHHQIHSNFLWSFFSSFRLFPTKKPKNYWWIREKWFFFQNNRRF